MASSMAGSEMVERASLDQNSGLMVRIRGIGRKSQNPTLGGRAKPAKVSRPPRSRRCRAESRASLAVSLPRPAVALQTFSPERLPSRPRSGGTADRCAGLRLPAGPGWCRAGSPAARSPAPRGRSPPTARSLRAHPRAAPGTDTVAERLPTAADAQPLGHPPLVDAPAALLVRE